ncbi:MAG: DUF1844 domain-containing protein [Candidatus Aminicenantales bacterium]
MSEHDHHKPNGAEKGKIFLPPLDFSSIVALLYIPAKIKLGLLVDPNKGELETDLPQAHRLIDLLDLLADRTKGRLESEEEKFLEFVLQELKMQFLEKSEAVKL